MGSPQALHHKHSCSHAGTRRPSQAEMDKHVHANKRRCAHPRPPRSHLCPPPLQKARALQSSPPLPHRSPARPTGSVPKSLVPCQGTKGGRGRSLGAGVRPGQAPGSRGPLPAVLSAHWRWKFCAERHFGPGAGGRGGPARCAAALRGGGGGAQALLPRGRLCGECSSTDCRRRTSRSSQSVSGSRPLSTARRSCRLLAEGNSR